MTSRRLRRAARTTGTTVASLLLGLLAAGPCLVNQADAQSATASLHGVVRLESGSPLAATRVSISETGDNLFSALVATDTDGSFDVTVPKGTYSVTAFSATSSRTPSDLLDSTVRGLVVDRDVSIDITARRGTVVQTAVVSSDGTPMPGARIDVFDASNEITRTAFADETGWVRFVATVGQSLFVTPAPRPGRDIARWLRFEELGADATGIARPIRLDALDAPLDSGGTVIPLLHGSAPGPHVRIALVSEGFTDLDEPFVDKNGNGTCDNEPFLDVDGDGKYGPGDLTVDVNGNGKRDNESFTDLNGDGVWNHGERALFLQTAVDHLRMMLGFPVYRELRDNLDVDAIFVPSRQAGSDYPSLPVPVLRDTRYDSRFLSLNFIFNYDNDKLVAEARSHVPTYDLLGMITYNVFGTGRETGGGTVGLFASRRTDLDFVCAHEFGHSLGRLADEYFAYDGAPPYGGIEPNYPNVTKSSAIDELKWARFVPAGTSLPTPDGTVGVGAFEGGYYRRHGILRPAYNCMMRKFAIFCPVCAESMSARIASTRGVARPAAPSLSAPLDSEVVDNDLLVGIDIDDLARVESVQPLVNGQPAGMPSRVSPFDALVDVSAHGGGTITVSADVTFVGGTHSVTPAVTVSVTPRDVQTPTVADVRFMSGTVVLKGINGIVVPGAVLFVDGVDRFPLELANTGSARVVKSALGSASNARIRKAVRAGRQVTLVVVNADGGRSAPIPFTR